MASLRGAPSLTPGAKKPFSYSAPIQDYDQDDDDYIGTVDTEEDVTTGHKSDERSSKKSKSKKDKKSKEKKKKKKHKDVEDSDGGSNEDGGGGGGLRSSASSKKDRPAATTTSDTYEDDFYDDDFDDEPLDTDDYIPPADTAAAERKTSTSFPTSARAPVTAHDLDAEERRVAEQVEARLRAERESHEREVAQWQAAQKQKEEELQQKVLELQQRILSSQSQPPPSVLSVEEQVARAVQAQLAAAGLGPSVESVKDNGAATLGGGADHDAALPEGQRAELQRRRQRERERALHLRRVEEEEAAHTLFRRLAQDVREVFHELNLSVVAAEKERMVKDERYRKEREMKDRREEMERAEKLQKELAAREEREAKYWALTEQREDKFRAFLEERLQRDEEERESRLKRDLEDRATRTRNERELHEELDKMEKDRRAKAEAELRERDTTLLQTQLEELKSQYRAQLEEIRRHVDLDRAHAEELHRAELQLMEKRHEAALQQQQTQHAQQLTLMETHTSNSSKLEKLIEHMHSEMEATQRMNEQLTQERLTVMREKERQLEEQRALLDAVLNDLKSNKQELEKERARIASLYAKFELSLSGFIKNSEEDRRHFQEAQAHQDTLRQQAEKDRRMMLTEIAQERKLLEQQQEELLSRKMDTMSELQAERMAISRERTEAAVTKERQNRDETELLKSLRAREEEYRLRVESIEADRVAISEMKLEQQRTYEAVLAERNTLRKERELFELEKEELLGRFEEVRRQASDSAAVQERLRRELVEERASREAAATEGRAHADPMIGVTSRFQMDLAKQRAILQKISS